MDYQPLAKKALQLALTDFGYSAGMVSDLINGNRKPSLEKATEIEEQIGIPASAWQAGVPLDQMWAIIMKGSK